MDNISKIKAVIANNHDFIIFGGAASIISAFVYPFIPANYLKTAIIFFLIISFAVFFILPKIKKSVQPSKSIILRPMILLFSYFIFTFILWLPIRNNDWFFYEKLLFRFLKQPELSQNVVLVNVDYPDQLTFRRNIALFLNKLANLPEKPYIIGLDIIFKKLDDTLKKIEDETRKSKKITATDELIKAAKNLISKGVDIIAGYDPQKKPDYYDEQLIGEKSPFTDVGHNLIYTRDGKLHAKVFEEISSSSKIGTDLKPFFAILIFKYGNKLIGEDYPSRLEKRYNNILPIRYQREFTFTTFNFPEDQDFKTIFANKVVLIGNREKDYSKTEENYYEL